MRRSRSEQREKAEGEWLEFFKYIVLAVVLSLTLRAFVIELISVDGDSMTPTLLSDELMLVDKLTYKIREPEPGEIIVCLFEGFPGAYVKRVIALPGDTVEIRGGVLYVNGSVREEPYLPEGTFIADMEPQTVPEKCVFVMGDNRRISMDSRSKSVGPIPYNKIIGRVRAIVWPLDRMRGIG